MAAKGGLGRKRAGELQRYPESMKIAVSIPDDVFEQAERLARGTRKSRSQFYADALREYVARHAPEEVTNRMDQVCSELDEPVDEFVSAAASRILARSEW